MVTESEKFKSATRLKSDKLSFSTISSDEPHVPPRVPSCWFGTGPSRHRDPGQGVEAHVLAQSALPVHQRPPQGGQGPSTAGRHVPAHQRSAQR